MRRSSPTSRPGRKFIHGNDIKENTGKKIANMQTEKYKARQAAYRAFITATVPEKG